MNWPTGTLVLTHEPSGKEERFSDISCDNAIKIVVDSRVQGIKLRWAIYTPEPFNLLGA